MIHQPAFNEPPASAIAGFQKRFIQVLALFALLATAAALGIDAAAGTAGVALSDGPGLPLIMGVLNLAVLFLTWQDDTASAGLALVASLTVGAVVGRFTPFAAYGEALAIIGLLAGAALASRTVYLVANLVLFVALGIGLMTDIQAEGTLFAPGIVHDVTLFLALLVLSVSGRFLLQVAQRSLARANRTANLLRANAEIGQLATQALNTEALFGPSVELLRRRFGAHHAQIYLVNEAGDQAVLAASTGEAGTRLLERQHRLAIGSATVIGQVAAHGETVRISDVEDDPQRRDDALLPQTRSQLALPLLDGETVIGVLDVQSAEPNDFSDDDARALEISANLIATALRSARLAEREAEAQATHERLIAETEGYQREIERLNRQITEASWSEYLNRADVTGITLEGGRLTTESAWTPELLEAAHKREAVIAADGERAIIAVPILLRGEVIGAIEVEPGADDMEDTADVLQAVAERLAANLESARLFEEAREAAAQQQWINDISTQYQTVNSVDDLLRITLTELGQTLGARDGSIRVGGALNGEVDHA